MNQSKIFQVALSLTPGIGDINAKLLLSYCGSADEIFKSPKSKLLKIPGVGEKTVDALKSPDIIKNAEREVEQCIKLGISILFFADKDYPSRLKHAPDSPVVLYYKGTANLNHHKIIGIVGTRQATFYGKSFVDRFVSDLKIHDPLIVSGLAYGIDIQAHKASLNNNLSTIGITASGLNTIYPAVHKDTAFQMLEKGGVMTEFRIGTKPDAHNFPMRNRVIAGICDALVVVEAASSGGALITAEIANSYNKDVFAVPGNIDQKYSEGCNNLIKSNKAHLLTNVKDLEYIMNWNIEENSGTNSNHQLQLDFSELDDKEIVVIKTLKEAGSELHIDELGWKTNLPINQIASILLNLEFKSFVKSLPGKKFRLLK
jgi:DNA processing protein